MRVETPSISVILKSRLSAASEPKCAFGIGEAISDLSPLHGVGPTDAICICRFRRFESLLVWSHSRAPARLENPGCINVHGCVPKAAGKRGPELTDAGVVLAHSVRRLEPVYGPTRHLLDFRLYCALHGAGRTIGIRSGLRAGAVVGQGRLWRKDEISRQIDRSAFGHGRPCCFD